MRLSRSRLRAGLLPVVAAAALALPWMQPLAHAMDRGAQLYAQNNPPRQNARVQAPPKVYLLRGFLNVFSLGMDDIASKLQADGIQATVTNHADEDLITSRIVAGYNAGDRAPVVLIGHSLGADAVVDVADALARYGIPVALLVLFDGTVAHEIPANVVTAINYTKHFMITPAPGSRGAVSNVDLSNDPAIDHLNIDTTPSLQAQTVNAVLQTASAASRQPPARRP